MTISRRGFLTAMLAAGAAPYVMSGGIGRGVLMPVRELWVPRPDLDIQQVLRGLHEVLQGEMDKAMMDSLIYGVSYMRDGFHIPIKEAAPLIYTAARHAY